MHKNGKEMKYTSASQQGVCKPKKHDCGAPTSQGEYWSGLNSPILSTDNKVTGATTNMLRKENRKNDTHVRRIKDHKHIGILMKENPSCQLSCYHLASIKITFDLRVWKFITQIMKH